MKRNLIVAGIACLVYAASCTPKATMTTTADKDFPNLVSAVAGAKPSVEASEGMEIYRTSCGRCHDLKQPGNYTESQWVPILDDMAVKAKLSAEQKAKVKTFVSFYAKPSK